MTDQNAHADRGASPRLPGSTPLPPSIQRRVCRRRCWAHHARMTISSRAELGRGCRPAPDTRRNGSRSHALVVSPVRGSGPHRQSRTQLRADHNAGRWDLHLSGNEVERSHAMPSPHLELRLRRTVSRETPHEGGLKSITTHPAPDVARIQTKPLSGRSANRHAPKQAKWHQ